MSRRSTLQPSIYLYILGNYWLFLSSNEQNNIRTRAYITITLALAPIRYPKNQGKKKNYSNELET